MAEEESKKNLEEKVKLWKELNKEKKESKRYDDYSEDHGKNVKKSNREAKEALHSMQHALRDLNVSTFDLYDTTRKWLSAYMVFEGAMSLTGMVKGLVESNNNFHRLIVNAGAANVSLKDANDSVSKLQINLGATFKDAQDVISTLASKQYVGNLTEAAEGAYSLARASGLAKNSVAELTVELQKTGKLSTQAINGIYADILKIQQANGLTKEGLTAVSNQIVKMAGNMRAFGQSDQQIRKMAAGATQLVSALEKVGISAQKANEWIDKLTDPERIEENIGLYAQLGMSVSDALSGNFDTTQMQNGLKDFGEKVKAMGPIAGSAYAKAFGMTFNEAVKAADMDGAVERQLTPQEEALNSIKELTENTKTNNEKMADSFNKLMGKIMKLGPVTLTIIGVIGAMLGKRITTAIDNAIKRANEGSKESADEAIKNADNVFKYEKINANNIADFRKKMNAETTLDALNKLDEETAKQEKKVNELSDLEANSTLAIEDLKKKLLDARSGEEIAYYQEQYDNMVKANEKQKSSLEEARQQLEGMKQTASDINEALMAVGKVSYEVSADPDDIAKAWDKGLNKSRGTLVHFADQGGFEMGKSAGESVGKSLAIGTKKVANALHITGKNSLVSGAKAMGGPIINALKVGGRAIEGGIKTAGGFFSGLFKGAAKEAANDIEKANKKNSGANGALGKVGGALGKVAMIGGIVITLLGPLIAAIKDTAAIKDLIQSFQDKIKGLTEGLKPTLETISTVGQKIISVVLGVLGKVLETLGNTLKRIAPVLSLLVSAIQPMFDIIGDILDALLPVAGDLIEVLITVISPVLWLIGKILTPVVWILKLLQKAISLITWPIRKLAEWFSGKHADDIAENTEAIENSTELKGEQLSVGAGGAIYSSGISGSPETSSSVTTSTTTAGATQTNSTTQTDKGSGVSSLEGKISELNNSVKQLIDIESKKLGAGEAVNSIGDKIEASLNGVKNGAPMRVAITELSTMAALQMQSGIIGLAASTVNAARGLFSNITSNDVSGTTGT